MIVKNEIVELPAWNSQDQYTYNIQRAPYYHKYSQQQHFLTFHPTISTVVLVLKLKTTYFLTKRFQIFFFYFHCYTCIPIFMEFLMFFFQNFNGLRLELPRKSNLMVWRWFWFDQLSVDCCNIILFMVRM